MGISKRLRTVADAVTCGSRVADIGTDHGYVPIYLVKKRRSPGAIAVDVNQGPLARAAENIRAENLSGKIAVRLGSGLKPLAPEEADAVVIAGMGGELICRILNDSPEFMEAGKEFILQPQSEWFKVRRLLARSGYQIVREWFLKEDGKYYLVIKTVPQISASKKNAGRNGESLLQSGEKQSGGANAPHKNDENPASEICENFCYEYSAYLIKTKNPVYREYLEKELKKKNCIARKLECPSLEKPLSESSLQKRIPTRSSSSELPLPERPLPEYFPQGFPSDSAGSKVRTNAGKRAVRYEALKREIVKIEELLREME